jgi:hypothetical protein
MAIAGFDGRIFVVFVVKSPQQPKVGFVKMGNILQSWLMRNRGTREEARLRHQKSSKKFRRNKKALFKKKLANAA